MTGQAFALKGKAAVSAEPRHFLTDKEFSPKELADLLAFSATVKKSPEKYASALQGKTLIMLFQKTSTRTRLSFEAGMTQLGGHAIYLDWGKTNFTLGSLQDETRCLARYGDLLMARVYKQSDLETMARASSIPVINGLSDTFHPCQALADLLTIQEKKGKLQGLKLAFIGDGNNVCNSLLLACSRAGMEVAVGGPRRYWPQEGVLKDTRKHGTITLTEDPKEAVKGADVVYTDTWVSMGQEAETELRLSVFKHYQLNDALLKEAKPKAIVMHCLPAHRGREITDDVLDSPQSVVFDQAENRLHVQKALMLFLLGRR